MAKKSKISKKVQKFMPKSLRKFVKNQGIGAVLGFASGFVADTAVEYVTRLEQRRQSARAQSDRDQAAAKQPDIMASA